MKKIIFFPTTLFLFCSACNNQPENSVKQDDVANASLKQTAATTSNSKIRNGINLDAQNLNVTQAFLMYDDGTLVPPENTTSVGRPVILRLIIDDGWSKDGDKVSIGASEKIETSEGNVMLDEKDLFANTPTVNAEDAKYISLTANISRLDKLYDYFLVSFRVWDKKGNGEVSGNYKLYVN